MQVPLTVCFQEMPVDESMRSACWEEAERLERYFDRITGSSCPESQSSEIGLELATWTATAVESARRVLAERTDSWRDSERGS